MPRPSPLLPPLPSPAAQAVLQCYEAWAAMDMPAAPLKSSLVALKLRECLRGSRFSPQVRARLAAAVAAAQERRAPGAALDPSAPARRNDRALSLPTGQTAPLLSLKLAPASASNLPPCCAPPPPAGPSNPPSIRGRSAGGCW